MAESHHSTLKVKCHFIMVLSIKVLDFGRSAKLENLIREEIAGGASL